MVYEHNEDGRPIQGSIQNLLAAVELGKEIRTMTITNGITHTAPAEQVWSTNGIVYVQNTTNISAVFEGDQLVFVKDAYHFYYTLDTNGNRHMSRWSIGGKKANNDSDQVAIRWFVK